MENVNIEIKRPIDKKEYAKKYYLENKERMIKMTIEAQKKRYNMYDENKKQKTVLKLNSNGFKRIPLKTLKKYNIVWDEENKKYA